MTYTHPRPNPLSWLQVTALAVFAAIGFGAWTSASAQTSGYHDFSYGGTITAPTGSKPESKLWFNDGIWWAVMFNTTLQGTNIYRLDTPTQVWSDTGTTVDDRAQSVGDALWDQASNHLYIVSNLHINSAAPNPTSTNWGRLYRYTYNSGTKTYALDSGFPVTVTKGKEETLTIAKDSTGKLWVTYVESSKVMVNHSNGSDTVWATPSVLPVNATTISTTSDDIASIVAFGGNKIGILWSNQSTDRDYFAIHNDGDPDTTWQTPETAWGGGVNCTGLCADDHINVKTDSAGKIYAAIKTSFTADTDPFIVLIVRSTSGVWTSATESLHANTNTRGIVLLDEPHNRLYVLKTSTEAGGNILYKATSMSSPSFNTAGQGDLFVDNPIDAHLNNATSTKQNITAASGMLVMASDDTSTFYAHNFVIPGPVMIVSFSPASGPSGTSVVLTGVGFTGVTSVKFNGVNASSFTVNSATQITATAPASVTTGPITVTASGGTGTSGGSFQVVQPVPTITSITPTSGIAGSSVVINGTNFVGITAVALNGTPIVLPNYTVNSSIKITATVPCGATTGKITVTNSGGTGTSASNFTMKPAITSLSPNSGAIGLPITINGCSLAGTTSVKFFNNKTATLTVISDTQVNTAVPSGATTGNLTLTTPGGTATSAFTVAPAATVTSFAPPSGPVGTTVTITGTNFGSSQGASTISFNGTLGTVVLPWSNTSVKAQVPAAATTGPITVNAPGGPASSSTSFLVTPVISSFSPTTGGQGTAVTITGTGFTGATTVKFNGTTATFNVTDAAHIATTVPSGATTGTLSVTTPGGTATSSGTFTVLPPPTITSFTPGGGAVGTQVTITGTQFGAAPQGTRTVKFNGVLAAAASVWSDTSITVQVPTSATIGPITVTTDTGVGTSATNFFPAPVISSFAPTSGSNGTVVLLTGLNFTGTNAVAFNGGVASTVTVDSDTSIHATVPASGSTGPISVTTPNGGTGSTATNFTISALITGVSPTSAPVASVVTINGSGFGITQGTSSVTFGGTPATTINSWGPTSIQATVPSVSQGSKPIIVTVGGQPSNGFPFTVVPPFGSVPPSFTSFTPFEGIPGTTVTLNGANFTGTTAVTFNGTGASFTFVNDSQITAVVPATATTGPISVTNGVGTTLTSSNFTVSTLIKKMTFEGPGGLTDSTTGADAVTGVGIVVDTTNALKDIVSAHVTNSTGSFVTENFSAADDLYVTFYLRINALPAAIPRIAEIRNGSTVVGNINISTGGALRLNSSTGTLVASSSALTVGQIYRVLLHQKRGTGANGLLEAFFAQGETVFPASPFASTTTGTWTTAATLVNMGNTSGTAATDITLDNVQVDAGLPVGAAAPLINSLTPNSGHPGDTIVIAGLNFGASQNGSTSVKFGATTALLSDIVSWSDTSISVKVPATATTGNVVVTNTNNVPSNAVPFTVNGTTISAINPTSGAIGATVTVTGTGLDTVTSATINGSAASITPGSATQITLTVGAGTTGSGPIVVTSPNGSASSAPTNFTVVPSPVITNLSSPSGAVAQSITITGTNFGASQVTGSKVAFNGTTAPVTSWSDTSIVVPVPAGATTGNVVVSAAGVDSNGLPFTVTPAITNLSPNSGAVGASVVITGTSFGASQGGSTVTFNNGQLATATAWSDTSITVTVPNSAVTGNVTVTVGGNTSPGVNFTVVPPPSITNLSAGSGPVGSSVTITGTNFGSLQGTSTVKFGAQTAVVNTWTDTSIGVTVPAFATAGSVNVVVTVGGVDSNNSPFTILPNITGVSPSSGPANTPVIINGTSFGASGTVTFNGTPATNVTNWSATSISVTVPVGAATGLGSVVVTSASQTSNGFNFTVIPPPSVSGVSPNSGFAGSTVTVQGANFGATQGTSTVTFNGTPATINGTWTDTSIPVIVPAIPTGSASVVVTVSNQPSNGGSFTVVPNLVSPTINSFTPTTGSGGTIVVISGANFSGTTDVKFNGTSAASFNVDSDAQITAVAPAGVTTGPISVTNAGGTTTSVTNFTLSLIKLSTFEANGGALTDPSTGVTSTSGTGLSVETVSPLKGSFSARANGGSSYLQDTFTGKDDVYASFYLRLNALPAAGVRIAMFLDGSTTVGNFNLTTTGALTLRNGTTAIGANSAPLAIGQVYHVALHQKKGTGANAVLEGFLAVGDAAFGVPFASSSTGTWIDQATSFRLGATIATAVDLVVDNIQIDTTLPFSAPAPSITGFNPTSGTVGTSVTISGTNFGATQSGGSVKFNGVTAVPTTWSTSSIVATVPASATTGPITVITAGGTASTINLATPNFTVNGATPNITDFTPASGPVGTQITINGSNLSGATSVTVNGTAVQSIDSNTAVQIKVTVASATTGSGPIVVNTPGGQATSATNFTVAAAPTVTSFTPTAGLTGASVVISGTGFTGASAVKFNGTSATTFTVDSDIQITVTVPGSATSGLVSVTTSNGTGTSANPFTVGAPTVTNFTPSGGPETTSVTITGTNFGSPQGSSAVKFNATTAAGVTSWSDTSITVPVPAGATTGTVSVTTSAGTGTSVNSFAVGAVPVVSNFTPAGGPVGTSVTITGTGFGASQGGTIVKFNTTTATGPTAWGDTSITIPVPAGATTGTISVTTATGTGTSANSFTVGAAPTVTNFNPTGGPVGTSVTITGTGFGSPQGTSSIAFHGTNATSVSNWSDTSITALVPTSATSGTISVTTVTGTGTSAASYTVGAGPTVTGFSPTAGLVGATVVISGTGFTGASAVTFHNTSAITFNVDSDIQITATVPAGATTGTISVTTGAGTGTSANSYTVGAPTVTSFTPAGGPVGTSVTITGTNFGGSQGTSTVAFGATTAAPATSWSSTSITVAVPAGASSGTISVTTAAGTGTSVDSFVVGAAPVVSNFNPPGGPVGTSVTITGTGFGASQGTSTVKFNNTTATGATAWGDTSITIPVPAGATSGAISVTTATGTGTSGASFVVGAAPTVTNFSPLGGPVGTSVVITGTGFGSPQGTGTVAFGATNATSISNWSDTSITATVPTGATTGAISVTTATGTGSSATNFVVGPAPTVTGFAPTAGVVGASIVVSGTGFTGAGAVKFNGTSATSFTVDNDGQITAAVPSGATSGPISVTTVTGTGTSASSFTVTPPAPVISSFTPTSGPVGTQVTINGLNLGNASSVTIGGVAAAIGTNSATQIVATVGNGAAIGPALIFVTTPGGTADSSLDSPANFTVTVVSNPPSITSFTPTSGGAGTLVTVNGVNFTGTTSVTFNGTSALFNFVSDSQLTATVPAGATTGPISVTNGSGTTDTTNLNPANFSITRVKDITFEAGSLTGTSGFGSTTGAVTLETGSPLKGADSMTVATGTSFGTQSYTATDEIFISLYVRLAAIPAGQVRVVRITDAGTSVGALTLETTGKLTLRSGTTSIAATPTALVVGTLYRIGIHQKKGTGSNAVLEGLIATGDAAFTTPFATSSTQTFTTQADSVQIGATTGTAGSMTIDDIRLDTGSMPGPSIP